jgi:hypothetical protein
MYVKATEPGFVRVSIHPHNPGVRMSITDLIRGLAKRGRARA